MLSAGSLDKEAARAPPFEGPIHAEPRAAKPAEVCACSPFCRGAASADWTSCVPGYRACRPAPWQASTRTPVASEPIEATHPSKEGASP